MAPLINEQSLTFLGLLLVGKSKVTVFWDPMINIILLKENG